MLITRPEDVTPAWLTVRLRDCGALDQGEVSSLTVAEEPLGWGAFATTAALQMPYTPEASGRLPRHLFLKLSRFDLSAETLAFGNREVSFYHTMAGVAEAPLIPRCYDAVYCDADTHASHLLLDDLSRSHRQTVTPIPPSERHSVLLVESLADLHALWWESPRLYAELAPLCRDMDPDVVRSRLEASVPAFMEALGEALLPWQQQLYDRVLASSLLTGCAQRLRTARTMTLTHGDAHPSTCLLPRDPARDRVVLIDWHLWEIGVATDDLAFLMARGWSPQRRAALETSLLRRYHQRLLDHGVTGYSWSACWHDYRISVALMTLVPIAQVRRKLAPGVIWTGLENSTAAYRELGCDGVLTAGRWVSRG